jgi:plastocyanin
MVSLSKILRGAAVMALAAAGLAARAQAGEVAVDQKDLMFTPDSVTIKAGDSVRFKDSDRIAHDITIVNPDGSSEDKGMDTYNVQILVPFSKPGVYHVRCRIHPTMKMTVTVTP